MSRRLNADLLVVYAEAGTAWRTASGRKPVEDEEEKSHGRSEDLCVTLGAEFLEVDAVDAVEAIIRAARERRITQVFMGRPEIAHRGAAGRPLPALSAAEPASTSVDVHVISEDPAVAARGRRRLIVPGHRTGRRHLLAAWPRCWASRPVSRTGGPDYRPSRVFYRKVLIASVDEPFSARAPSSWR